jgi:hypothetical protein
MMYGEEKRLQMARSILPSRARKRARDEKRAKNQRVRHGVKQDLRRCMFDEDFADEADLFREPSWSYYVRERQEADKLAHFEKWAIEITKDIAAVDGRRAYIRALLPPGLIGWHAMSHLDSYDEFQPNPFAYGRVPGEPSGRQRSQIYKQERKERKRKEYEERVEALAEIVKTPGGHRLLNRYMIQTHKMVEWSFFGEVTPARPTGLYTECVGPKRPRLLRGLGDIEPFLKALRTAANAPALKVSPYLFVLERRVFGKGRAYRWEEVRTRRENPDHHPEWIQAVSAFLGAWARKFGDLNGIRQALQIR